MSPSRRRVVVRAPGKINLSLIVGAVDDRGYHALATVFHAVGLYETITVEPAPSTSLSIDSHVVGDVPTDGTNLALRAADLLREHTGRRDEVAIRIRKEVPVAGGMGGGSADAAATLMALNSLWELDLPPEELRHLGARLGADVPFAMLGHTALGRGMGDDLSSVLATGTWQWVLAVPGGHLSTPAVYRVHDRIAHEAGRPLSEHPEADPAQLQALRGGDVALLGETLDNDLQAASFELEPRLIRVVEAAEDAGAYGAMVSGSGPTIAALAGDREHAEQIAAQLRGGGLVHDVLIAEGNVAGARVLDEE